MNRPSIEGKNRQDFYRQLTDGQGDCQCDRLFFALVREWGFDRVDETLEQVPEDQPIEVYLRGMSARVEMIECDLLDREWNAIRDLARQNSTYVHCLLPTLEDWCRFVNQKNLSSQVGKLEQEGIAVWFQMMKHFLFEMTKTDITRAQRAETDYYEHVFQRIDTLYHSLTKLWKFSESQLIEYGLLYEKMEQAYLENLGEEVFKHIHWPV